MLAVVQDKQDFPRSEVETERIRKWSAWHLPHPQDRGNRLRHELRVRERGEFNEPGPILVPLHLGSHLQSQACLARAARPGER